MRRSILGLTIAVIAAILGATSAHAFSDSWACSNYVSAQKCYSGAGYHSWVRVTGFVHNAAGDGVSVYETCAKGITAAGNIRSGSGCAINFYLRESLFSGGTPMTVGYNYWGGSGGPWYLNGTANT